MPQVTNKFIDMICLRLNLISIIFRPSFCRKVFKIQSASISALLRVFVGLQRLCNNRNLPTMKFSVFKLL